MKHRRIEILQHRHGWCFRPCFLPRWCGFCWPHHPLELRCRYRHFGTVRRHLCGGGVVGMVSAAAGSLFADDLCETLDALLSGRQPENYQPYEDSLTAKVQGKLMQYFDIMSEGKRQSQQDKQVIQSLVSDISHQVKTPLPTSRCSPTSCSSTSSRRKSRRNFCAPWRARSTSWTF